MQWELSSTSGLVAGIVSIVVGIVVIKWPKMLAVLVGLYFIFIGVLAILNAVD